MTENIVHKKIQEFAFQSVSFSQFYEWLMDTDESNSMFIKWRTSVSPTRRVSYELYWGDNYSNSKQSRTKAAEGMINLVVDGSNEEEWRTLTYDNISSFRYQGKTYTIKS